MKKIVGVLLTMLSAFATLSAQTYVYHYTGVQWSPQLGEDNKAATWEDTRTFLVNSFNDDDHVSLTLPQDLPYRVFADMTYSASSPARCQLSIGKALEDAAERYTTRETILIDLSRIDPLTIIVKGVNHRKSPMGFVISLQGSNDSTAITGTRFVYDKEKRARLAKYGNWYPMWNNLEGDMFRMEDVRTFTCDSGDKKCSQQPISESSETLSVKDQETSKRIALALMHAALLCGGPKSVSPF